VARRNDQTELKTVGADSVHAMRDHSADRLATLEALTEAVSRRSEVLAAVWDSDDDVAAVQALRHLLRCDELAAQQMLDISWRRLTRAGRDRIAAERDELRAQHDGG
jgi:DNA gyrase/topoisomerase IV subunit A